eukprot:198350-Amphidinium_carterae.1
MALTPPTWLCSKLAMCTRRRSSPTSAPFAPLTAPTEGRFHLSPDSKLNDKTAMQVIRGAFAHLPAREDMERFRRSTLAYPIGYGDTVFTGPMDPYFKVIKPNVGASALTGPKSVPQLCLPPRVQPGWFRLRAKGRVSGHSTSAWLPFMRPTLTRSSNLLMSQVSSLLRRSKKPLPTIKAWKGSIVDEGVTGRYAIPLHALARARDGNTATGTAESMS